MASVVSPIFHSNIGNMEGLKSVKTACHALGTLRVRKHEGIRLKAGGDSTRTTLACYYAALKNRVIHKPVHRSERWNTCSGLG